MPDQLEAGKSHPFHNSYRNRQRRQIRRRESCLERVRRMAPHHRQAPAQAEETPAQMQAALTCSAGAAPRGR